MSAETEEQRAADQNRRDDDANERANASAERDAETHALDLEKARQAARTQAAQDALTLEGSKLDNKIKMQNAEQASADKLNEAIKGAVPDLSKLAPSSVTTDPDTIFRSAESESVARTNAASHVSSLVVGWLVGHADIKRIVLTTDSSLAADFASYRVLMIRIRSELDAGVKLIAELRTATAGREQSVTPIDIRDLLGTSPLDRSQGALAFGKLFSSTAVTAAGTIADTAVQLVSLLKTESTVSALSTDQAEFPLLARLASRLVDTRSGRPNLEVVIPSVVPVTPASELSKLLTELATSQLEITSLASALTDQDKSLAAEATAMSGAMTSLWTEMTAGAPNSGSSPLQSAFVVERLVPAEAEANLTCILVVPVVKARSDQISSKRIFWKPRLEVSTFIEMPFMVLHQGKLAMADVAYGQSRSVARVGIRATHYAAVSIGDTAVTNTANHAFAHGHLGSLPAKSVFGPGGAFSAENLSGTATG